MKDTKYLLNTLLALVLGICLSVCVLIRTFAPAVILPQLDIPNMVLISLLALLPDHYLAPHARRCYICIPIFSGLTFGLLPFAAAFVGIYDALKLGLLGCVVFTAVTWLFSSMMDRLSSGPAARLAPVVSALGLHLASQWFMGIG